MTYEDVRKDLSFINDHIVSARSTVPSASKIWGLSVFVPGFCFILNFLSAIGFYTRSHGLSSLADNGFVDFVMNYMMYFGCATLVIGVFVLLYTYPNILIYLSMGEVLRKQSIIISKLLRKVKFIISLFFVVNIASAVMGVFEPNALFVAPASLFIFIFILMITLSTETARYGLVPLMGKLSEVANRFK